MKQKIDEIEKFEEEIVSDVKQDFKRRIDARKNIERQWQLNMNFAMGNQYCTLTDVGEIENFSKQYFWQEREVYNHITPILETRIAKLCKIRPTLSVAPNSSSEVDRGTAKLSRKILASVEHNLRLSEKINDATNWSELCGTSFYKVAWNGNLGNVIGLNSKNEAIKSGEIEISVCSPFEIFPESNTTETIDEQVSIIHAKPYKISQIEKIWGKVVDAEDVDVLSMSSSSLAGGLGYTASVPKIISEKTKDSAIVIERYEAPSTNFPNGRVVIVCGKTLLAIGELPYLNGVSNKRGYPFIKQCSLSQPSSFWGVSVIERLIPIQRSYNAIKNRKHEFLNRIAMGILSVEDGSVDINSLEEEGLSPGKVLVYRQGSTPPNILSTNEMPEAFENEENKLLEEFVQISGVSDLSVSGKTYSTNMSGIALELLIEQESNRLQSTVDQIRYAVIEIGKQILRLYKQFASTRRLGKLEDKNGKIEIFYWNCSDISSDDVVIDTTNEIGETLSQKRNMIFELLKAGLLGDENGNITVTNRQKILEMLGFGNWQEGNDMTELQRKRAGSENLDFVGGREVKTSSIDNDEIHIEEHTAFLLSFDLEKLGEKRDVFERKITEHIEAHKLRLNLQNKNEMANQTK